MLKISDFSKLSRISIRMLRFYDEKEILKPIIVKDNGYRYYEPTQLIIASHIQYLRYLGFSTDKIRNILSILQNSSELTEYLNSQLKELESERNKLTEKIDALSLTIQKINQEEIMMNYQVEIKEIPAKYMMCKRAIIPSYEKEGLLWNGMNNELKECQLDVEMAENGMVMAVFYDPGYKEKEVDIEIRVEVKGNYEDTENIKFRKIDPVKVASVTFTGGYEHITEIAYHIATWITEHNYEICGPDFSIYHVGYAQTDNPNEFVTEICYPIK
ncbi:MerR family transcriptional regulator [Beduini massiliensis]|uniref:MerR family transcriptional regulator n=1 Tax=Beduini massiliensis TaxID=1585974 RepID=UPI00059A79AC|nr:MerR family transcriptional regulator [Beduini massiliensis]